MATKGHGFEKANTKCHTLIVHRVFKTRHFARWMRKTELSDAELCRSVEEMRSGLIDADLGGYIVKKRVPLPGRGKRGGVRTLVATRMDRQWFFLFGFEKNERANVSSTELDALRTLAAELLALSGCELNRAVMDGALQEICDDDKDQSQEPNP